MTAEHHTRRGFLKAAGLGGAALACGVGGPRMSKAAGAAQSGAAGRPNIIYVFADQLGYSRCGYGGDTKARTLNIDRLAA